MLGCKTEQFSAIVGAQLHLDRSRYPFVFWVLHTPPSKQTMHVTTTQCAQVQCTTTGNRHTGQHMVMSCQGPSLQVHPTWLAGHKLSKFKSAACTKHTSNNHADTMAQSTGTASTLLQQHMVLGLLDDILATEQIIKERGDSA